MAHWQDSASPQPCPSETLAILPFKPLLPAERNESLELGMAESLIASLGQHSPQRISPLSSVRRYAALDQDPIAAGRELGVDTVLDGSLQRRDERLRVAVRLLRVADGTLGAELRSGLHDDLRRAGRHCREVAQAVSVRGVGGGSARSPARRSGSLCAVRERSIRLDAADRSQPAAIDSFFEQAIERDPNYALAYAGLADSYALLGVFGMRAPHEVFPMARAAVDKALSIDPDLAAAHSALGHIKMMYEHDWDGAAREYQRALQLDPALAFAYHRRGLLYAMQGDTDRAPQTARNRSSRLAIAQGAAAISSTLRDATTNRSGSGTSARPRRTRRQRPRLSDSQPHRHARLRSRDRGVRQAAAADARHSRAPRASARADGAA